MTNLPYREGFVRVSRGWMMDLMPELECRAARVKAWADANGGLMHAERALLGRMEATLDAWRYAKSLREQQHG